MKTGEYRDWQELPAHERMNAVVEITLAAYRMKGLTPDVRRLKELLSIFNSHKVKHLVVGAYAVSFYAQPRATNDIDLLIKPDTGNATAVYAALSKFGAPLEGLTAALDPFR